MSATEGLDAITDRLYVLPPAEFTAARDEAAKAARDGGDKPGAATIAKLRRPTIGAWMVNLLAIQRPDSVDELLELGSDLRAAQRDLQGPALRELTTKRRTAVGALVRQAVALAVATGAKAASLPVAEVETTLTAALADAEIAAVVRAGRLLKSGTYDGFGEPPRPGLRVVPPASSLSEVEPPEAKPKAKSTVDKAPDAAATARLDAATRELAEAETAYTGAVADVDARTRAVVEIEERLEALRQDRRTAHAAVLAANAASDAADADLQAARRRHAAAVRAAKRGS